MRYSIRKEDTDNHLEYIEDLERDLEIGDFDEEFYLYERPETYGEVMINNTLNEDGELYDERSSRKVIDWFLNGWL